MPVVVLVVVVVVVVEVVEVVDEEAITCTVTGELVTSDKDAVMLALPTARAVAKPAAEIVTTDVLELAQVT